MRRLTALLMTAVMTVGTVLASSVNTFAYEKNSSAAIQSCKDILRKIYAYPEFYCAYNSGGIEHGHINRGFVLTDVDGDGLRDLIVVTEGASDVLWYYDVYQNKGDRFGFAGQMWGDLYNAPDGSGLIVYNYCENCEHMFYKMRNGTMHYEYTTARWGFEPSTSTEQYFLGEYRAAKDDYYAYINSLPRFEFVYDLNTNYIYNRLS